MLGCICLDLCLWFLSYLFVWKKWTHAPHCCLLHSHICLLAQVSQTNKSWRRKTASFTVKLCRHHHCHVLGVLPKALGDLHTQFCHSSYWGWKLCQNTSLRLICFASSNNETWYSTVLFPRNHFGREKRSQVFVDILYPLTWRHGSWVRVCPIVYCQLTAWPYVQVPPLQLGNIRCRRYVATVLLTSYALCHNCTEKTPREFKSWVKGNINISIYSVWCIYGPKSLWKGRSKNQI